MQALKKGEKQPTLPQYLPNPKSKFLVKIIFTQSIFILLSTDKKAKTISLKLFKIAEFKNLHQEITKGTLRPLKQKTRPMTRTLEV